MSIANKIESVLSDLKGISLEEVLKASLMKRKDSKYVFDVSLLPEILEKTSDQYRVLDIQDIRAQDYQTFYYDTPDLAMYHMHHRGRVNRHKIRFRKYGSSNIMFLEVKKKDAKGVTNKNRMKAENGEVVFRSTEEEFLAEYTPFQGKNIGPVLENSFNRITLVNETQTERITLDYNLHFCSSVSKDCIDVPGVAIAEIKYGKYLARSIFHAALRSAGIAPRRISKYCLGMAILNPKLKQNLFKQKVRHVHKINNNHLLSLNN
jgi:hypothetical protein